ncbi:phage holin family protein [Anaerorhabdus sp.]|uniref:phage holin family protein n=1 Tax=Anaerorhabdus sp. TaxID=1872524 RepID=UPI002FCA4BC7
MENFLKVLKYIVAGIGTGLTWLFGTWDTALYVLAAFMILDYITGLLKGYHTKTLSSDVGVKGLTKKFMILIVIIVAVLLDKLMGMDNWFFRTLVCYFYIANEGLSILENATVLGLPLPPKLKEALEQLKQGNKKEIVNKE